MALKDQADPELVLLELEVRLLEMIDQAWGAYEANNGGFPPTLLLNLITKTHATIAGRLKDKLGKGFDLERPEMALIKIERIREMLLKKIEQRQRMSVIS